MGDSNTIKSFLVGLGFDVDNASYSKFQKNIKEATKAVTVLSVGITAMATGVAAAITKVSDGFEEMGYSFHILSPSINKVLLLREEMVKAYKAAGINIRQTVVDAQKLNISITKTKFAFEAIYKSVAAKFFPLLTKASEEFRAKIYQNMPRIQAALEKFVHVLFFALDALTTLGLRAYDMLYRAGDALVSLWKNAGGLEKAIIAVGAALAAWAALTPFGRMFTLLSGILLLLDDLEGWAEGKKALINWGSQLTEEIVGISTAIGGVVLSFAGLEAVIGTAIALKEAIAGLRLVTWGWAAAQAAVNLAMRISPFGLFITALALLAGGINYLYNNWDRLKKSFNEFFAGFGGKVLNFITNTKAFTGPGSSAQPYGPAPLGSNTNNNNNPTINLSQQTNMTLNGVPSSTIGPMSSAIGAQGKRNNQDLLTSLQGPQLMAYPQGN